MRGITVHLHPGIIIMRSWS